MKLEKPILFQVTMSIENHENVKLNITYSGEEDLLEFECVEISKKNEFSEETLQEIEKLLECGFSEKVIHYLEEYYRDSIINFTHDYHMI
jgi:predicted HicB family RNase H-like nuclease